MAKPVVGITTYLTPASFGVWETTAVLVPQSYVLGVERAGGRALLVPPSEDAIEETLDALDGLIFSGGSDLDPDLYGQEPHAETNGIVPERDRAELALLTAALERDLPVLAICRGSQVLNVALGGDLIQHLPDLVGHEKHKESPGEFSEHEVEIEPGSRLAGVLGAQVDVKSHHHQGHARLGAGLRVSARDADGQIEALEDPARRFAVGVLWHPEAGEDLRLFEALVEEAAAYRADRRSGGDRAHLRRAERAAARCDRDLAQALGAVARRRVGRRLRARAGDECVHRLDHEEEEDDRDQHEGNQRVQEEPVVEAAAVDRERELREVRLAEDRGDQRGDDVGDERRDHGPEGDADHDSDGHVHEVAAEQECLEVLHDVSFRGRANALMTGSPESSRERWPPSSGRRIAQASSGGAGSV